MSHFTDSYSNAVQLQEKEHLSFRLIRIRFAKKIWPELVCSPAPLVGAPWCIWGLWHILSTLYSRWRGSRGSLSCWSRHDSVKKSVVVRWSQGSNANASPGTGPRAGWCPSLCQRGISTSLGTRHTQTGRWRWPGYEKWPPSLIYSFF